MRLILSRDKSKMELGGLQDAELKYPLSVELNFRTGYILIQFIKLVLHQFY